MFFFVWWNSLIFFKGKSTPFLSPLGLKGEEGGAVKEVEKEKNGGSDDKVIFKSFKHTEEDKRDFVDQIEVGELENSVAEDIQESNKRKTPFEGLSSPSYQIWPGVS